MEDNLKIAFVLPRISFTPIGGYKVVYEYCNRLVADGFEVTIYYDNTTVMDNYKLPEFIKRILIRRKTNQSPNWFDLDKRVEQKSSRDKNLNNFFASVDVVVATDARTVKLVVQNFKKAKKLYFIQDFETDDSGKSWHLTKKQLIKTYNAGLTNIVVSKWLKNIVDRYTSEPAIYVQNAIDTNIYKIVNPINNRDKNIIGMLYHISPRKGCQYTLDAIKKVKLDFPNLKLIMFGACPPPDNLPNWVAYYQNVSQKETVEIYNKISIFTSGPIEEGFGLTSLEAMACGAALVSSDNLGVREYAINKENSLLSPVKNTKEMKENIEELLRNDNERKILAKAGNKAAQNYSWHKAYTKFKEAMLSTK